MAELDIFGRDVYGQPTGVETWPRIRQALGDIARGVSYYPYDLIGAPVDVANLALGAVGLGSKEPVLGSDYLRRIAQNLGYAQAPSGSTVENVTRLAAGFTNPAAGARAVGQVGNLVNRGANVSADKLVQMITRNPEATAMGVIDETSMPFMQAVAPKAPSLLQPQKSDLGFYSQLEAATLPLQNKGTGEQYLAQISKTPGVKPEELQWTGLEDFLKSRQSVTKAEIQDYLNANRVDVQEVRLGEPEAKIEFFNENQIARAGFDRPGYVVYDRNGRFVDGPFDDLISAEIRAEDVSAMGGAPKFSQYTLPGGENYREILLTLPVKQRTVEVQVPGSSFTPTIFETRSGNFELLDAYGEPMSTHKTREAAEQAVQEYVKPFTRTEVVEDPSFYSSHFDQPNILAHMRVNDRVVDGKKTLFVEEIQSDWHQAGRKKGYADAQKPFEVFNPVDGKPVARFATAEEAKKYVKESDGNLDYARTEGVPDAPFKTSWHELSLKRAIQEASEKGYDQIAFTTGKTQAERYDLSKQVDYIDYIKEEPDKYRIAVVGKNGQGVALPQETFSAAELENYVGKDVAQQIVKGEGQFDGGRMTLRGPDLQVGGGGMKGFYDNILPKSLEKLGKKFDAKVGKTEMDGVEVWQMDITPKMRESVTSKGQPLFAIPAIGTGLLGSQMQFEDQY